MPEAIIIRKAEAGDVDSVKNIEIACGLSSWQIEDYKNEVNREDAVFIVAELNKRIVGFILARLIMKSNYHHLNNIKILIKLRS